MNTRKRIRATLGSVAAVPLPDGKFGYVKILEDSWFGVYDYISNEIFDISAVVHREFSFFRNGTDEAIRNGSWPIIGEGGFLNPEDAWAPPHATTYSRDTNTWYMGSPRVHYKGETLEATDEQVRGLDIMSIFQQPARLAQVIVDRVINGNHEKYKVRAK